VRPRPRLARIVPRPQACRPDAGGSGGRLGLLRVCRGSGRQICLGYARGLAGSRMSLQDGAAASLALALAPEGGFPALLWLLLRLPLIPCGTLPRAWLAPPAWR